MSNIDKVIDALTNRLADEAKLADEAILAKESQSAARGSSGGRPSYQHDYGTRWTPERVRGEIDSQQQIVEEYRKLMKVQSQVAEFQPDAAGAIKALASGLELAIRIHAGDKRSDP